MQDPGAQSPLSHQFASGLQQPQKLWQSVTFSILLAKSNFSSRGRAIRLHVRGPAILMAKAPLCPSPPHPLTPPHQPHPFRHAAGLHGAATFHLAFCNARHLGSFLPPETHSLMACHLWFLPDLPLATPSNRGACLGPQGRGATLQQTSALPLPAY